MGSTTEPYLLHDAKLSRYDLAAMRPSLDLEAGETILRERRMRQRVRVFARVVLVAALSLAVTARAAGRPALTLSADDREALGRVAYAEAGSQREEGLAAVAHTVLNRVASGQFGAGVQAVLNAPGQFEPVMRAGGSWRHLPPLNASQRLVFGTILDLILQGRLPDLTAGSTYFQNAAIVARRAEAGQVSPSLVSFGHQTPAAVIRDHSFFRADHALAAAHQSLSPASQSAPGFYHVVAGRLVRANPVPQGAEPASQAKFIRVGATHGAGTHVRIIRGVSPAQGPSAPAF